MTQQLIEIKNLERSPLNVRQTESLAALDELKASILGHGLMQNLVVVPAKKGKYHVVAGGRRLAALQSLQEEGKLPADHAVPCQIAEGEHAQELSLAENTVRQAMHPADEFEAYAALIGKKHTAAQVAVRFGVTEKHVLQRMKLGRLAPELLAAYRAEELSLDSLMAFAITDDQKRQKSVWKSLEGWQENNAREIRKKLTGEAVKSDSKLAVFVGLDAYKAAGGKTREDLFSEIVCLENPELLHKLAGEKLEAAAAGLRAEGWGWVLIGSDDADFSPYRCGRIKAKPVDVLPEVMAELEKAEAEQTAIAEQIDATEDDDELDALYERDNAIEAVLAGIEERIEAFRQFDPEEMKGAGCYVTIDHRGDLDIEKGLVKPEDRKNRAPAGGDDTAPAREKPDVSQSLLADLKAYRCQVAQVEIAKHPEIAFDLMVFHVACGVIDHVSPNGGPDIHFRQSYPQSSLKDETEARKRLEGIQLSLEWLKHDEEAARFQEFRELSQAEKLSILAYCTALALKPDFEAEGVEESAYSIALGLTGAKAAAYWRPTKENYLSRISKDQLLAIGQEIYGGKWADPRKNHKKGEIVDRLDNAFHNPETNGGSHEKIGPDVVERLKTWMPKGMEFQHPAVPAEPKKAKRGKAA